MARYYRSFSSKKLSDYKWGIALISVLAVLTIALCVVTSGFKNWDVKTWFGNEPVCEHVFEDGKCTECGELEIVCEHEYKDGVCIKCEEKEPVECEEHEYKDGVCTQCGAEEVEKE